MNYKLLFKAAITVIGIVFLIVLALGAFSLAAFYGGASAAAAFIFIILIAIVIKVRYDYLVYVDEMDKINQKYGSDKK